MKPFLLCLALSLASCSTNNYKTQTARDLASASTKIRFFETRIQDNKSPTKLVCNESDCRFLEIEIIKNFLSIRSCEVSRVALFDGVSPEVSTKANNLNADCDEIMSDFEVTPEVLKSLEQQLGNKNLKTRDHVELLKKGTQTILGGVGTLLSGALTVGFSPSPIVLILAPGVVMTTGFTYNSAKDFIKEMNGKALPLNHSTSVQLIEAAAKKPGVSVFYIGTPKKGFNQELFKSVMTDEFERFIGDWKKFSYKLEALKNAQYEQNNYYDGHNFQI